MKILSLLSEIGIAVDGTMRFSLLIIVLTLTLISLLFPVYRYISTTLELKHYKKLLKDRDYGYPEGLNCPFSPGDVVIHSKKYIEPDCSQHDPSNNQNLRLVPELRAPLTKSVVNYIRGGGKNKFLFILADSGMGKTTFCLNIYRKLVKQNQRAFVLHSSRIENANDVRKIRDPQNAVLIIDALDEDPKAMQSYNDRLYELVSKAADFKSIIITCRSQFFTKEQNIPSDTGVTYLAPRKNGDEPNYEYYKYFLMPFDDEQIKKYLRSVYPVVNPLKFIQRRKAWEVVNSIGELSVRPMLLEVVPDLVKANAKISEVYELYDFMINQWLKRESKWIDQSTLLELSIITAFQIYSNKDTFVSGRITQDEIIRLSHNRIGHDHLSHFTSRSLLNRDSEGLFKFAHRSILEFLIVKGAVSGQIDALNVPWTDQMRQFFVSWGWKHTDQKSLSIAHRILDQDLEASGLSPLSDPLPIPGIISNSDISKMSKYVSAGVRGIPLKWREKSLKIKDFGGYKEVLDAEYDIVWKVVDLEDVDDVEPYRTTIVDYKNIEYKSFDLPSIQEFISLVDISMHYQSEKLLHKHELYWVGDQISKAKYILASLTDLKSIDYRLKEVGEIRSPVYDVKIRFFEYSYVGRARNNPIKASYASVKRGNIMRHAKFYWS